MIVKVAHSKHEINDAMMIRQAVFVDEQHVPINIELDQHDEAASHFVGYIKDKPMSASRLRLVNDYGKLERICVLKQFRNNSYGQQIIEKMEKQLLKMNISFSQLNSQVQAVNFYKRLGYRVISEPFSEANILHVTMKKQLK